MVLGTIKENQEEDQEESGRPKGQKFFEREPPTHVRSGGVGRTLDLRKTGGWYSGGGEKHPHPHTHTSSFVIRAVPDEEGEVRTFLSSSSFKEENPRKIELILDSGANESMVNKRSLIETLDTRKTRIITASDKNIETGFYGTPKKVFFPNNLQELKFGKENKIVFSENLTDNLVSVGRICETGYLFYSIQRNT